MRHKALVGSAALLSAVLALPSGCDNTRRDWDVCNSEPCQAGFVCNSRKQCVLVDAGSESGVRDGAAASDALDAAADGEASTDADAADAADDGSAESGSSDADATGAIDGPNE